MTLDTSTFGNAEILISELPTARLDGDRMIFESSSSRNSVEDLGVDAGVLYVRDAYVKLFDIVTPIVISGTPCILTGTFGIGKRLFSYYAIRRLLDQRVTVIYLHKGWHACHLLLPKHPDQSVLDVLGDAGLKFDGNQEEHKWLGKFLDAGWDRLDVEASTGQKLYDKLTQLKGRVTVVVDPPHVWDESMFTVPKCGVLLVTHPSAQEMQAIVNSGMAYKKYYMPLWTPEEIELLTTAQTGKELTEIEKYQLDLRIMLFGPIPRNVATGKGWGHIELMRYGMEQTREVIEKLTGFERASMMQVEGKYAYLTSRILHIKVNDSFERDGTKFASDMVMRRIWVKARWQSKDYWNAFAQRLPDLEGFAQNMQVESRVWWHGALERGGRFNWRELTNHPRTKQSRSFRTVILPPCVPRYSVSPQLSDVQTLWDYDSVKEKEYAGLYYHFPKGNVPSIDAIMVLDGAKAKPIFDPESTSPNPEVYVCFVQMTLDSKPTLASAGMKLLQRLMKGMPGAKCELIFVVKEEHASSCNFQYVLNSRCFGSRQWLISVAKNDLYL